MIIDPRAAVVYDEHRLQEESIREQIGSTRSGNGDALVDRVLREENCIVDRNRGLLQDIATIDVVASRLRGELAKQANVMVEGTQGFGLSLFHGPYYPYVTGKDTTAAGFASEVGLAVREVDEIILVARTYPIRVAGNSGPMRNEISWDVVRNLSGSPEAEQEYTSVTGRLRRVGMYDADMVKSACNYNKPTGIFFMGLDRIDHTVRGFAGKEARKKISATASKFVDDRRAEFGAGKVWGFGTGPGVDDFVWI